MSILDKLGQMAESIAMPLTQTTAKVGTAIDFGSAVNKNWNGDTILRNLNENGKVAWQVICEDEDFASAGTPVITYLLVTADNAALDSGNVTLATVVNSTLVEDGDQILRGFVPPGRVCKRYLGLKATVGTADLTAGKVTAWIGQLNDDNSEKS